MVQSVSENFVFWGAFAPAPPENLVVWAPKALVGAADPAVRGLVSLEPGVR